MTSLFPSLRGAGEREGKANSIETTTEDSKRSNEGENVRIAGTDIEEGRIRAGRRFYRGKTSSPA